MRPLTTSLLLNAWLAAAVGAQTSHWNRFAEFRGVADSVSMRWPSVVMARDTMIVAANVFPNDAKQPAGKRRLVVTRLPGGAMSLPPGEFAFAHPQLAIGARGAIHLIWSEAKDSADSLAVWSSPPASLWHAYYRAGVWSKPKQILAGRFLTWASDGRSIASDGSGRVHVVVPAVLSGGDLTITYLRIGRADTVEQELHWTGGSYASVTALRADSILVAYSTADSLTPRGGSATFIRVSADGGRSWGAPTVISRSDRRAASPPIIEQAGRTLHALWIEPKAGANVARAFTSRSPFGKWVEVGTSQPIRGIPLRFVSAATRCGGFASIVEILENPTSDARMRMREYFVRGNRVVEAEVFPQLETAANVAIAPMGDSLRIVLSVVRPREKTVINATATGRACGTT